MNKPSGPHRGAIGAAVACLVLALAGCGTDGSSAPGAGGVGCDAVPHVAFTGSIESDVPTHVAEPKAAARTIAYANGLDAAEPLHAEGEAARLETQRLGGTFVTADAKGNPDTQLSQIQSFIARRVDAIFVSVVDPKALAPVLQQAKAAGIPVVGVEVDLGSTTPPEGWTTQIWLGRDKFAYLQAQRAAERVSCGGTFVQMKAAVEVPAIDFTNDRGDYWAKKFGLKSLGVATTPSIDIAGGTTAMTQLLSEHPKVDALLGYGDEAALGAYAAARTAGRKDLVLIGGNGLTDGLEAVADGRIDSTVQMHYPEAGRLAVDALYDALDGGQVPPTIKAPDPTLVTSNNVKNTPTFDQALKKMFGRSQ